MQVKKQAKKHEVEYVNFKGLHELHIKVTTGRKYFCWDQEFFDRKSRAEGHMRRLIHEHRGSGYADWSKTWNIRVFKTQKGWGVFAEV